MTTAYILKLLIGFAIDILLFYIGRTLSGYKLIAWIIFSFLVILIFLYLTDIVIDYYFGDGNDDN